MAYAPHVASKRAYQKFKQVFRSELYAGKVGPVAMLWHWWAVRQIVKGRAKVEIERA